MSAAYIYSDNSNPEGKNETCQAQPQVVTEAVHAANVVINSGFARDPIINKTVKRLFSHDERADFYSGEDRHTLKGSDIERVRELHEHNDELQRQIITKRKELTSSSDQLALIADMEHCSILIARNTGEILKIYAQNEARIKRIAEIETTNCKLREDIMDMRDKFISNHDIQQRTKFAAEFFVLKDKLEKNTVELSELVQD
jgi:hypothetical protein